MADNNRLIRTAILLSVITFFLQGIDSRAQNTEDPKANDCPQIGVMTMAGIPNIGGMVWFELLGIPDTIPGLTYKWTVNMGSVDQGQSSKHIKVRYLEEMLGRRLTATVTISGLPEKCPNTASESLSVSGPHYVWVLLSKYSVPTNLVHKKNLKVGVTELMKNDYVSTHSQLYIIEYFPDGTNQATIRRKRDLVMDHLVRVLKFDRSRVTIVTAESPDNKPYTKIYSVPPGSDNPLP